MHKKNKLAVGEAKFVPEDPVGVFVQLANKMIQRERYALLAHSLS